MPVWQKAMDLAVKVHALTSTLPKCEDYGLTSQMRRSAVSISDNIAEGFERGTTPEVLTFLYIARGSCGEARSMLSLLERLPGFKDLKLEISNLKSKGGTQSLAKDGDRK